MANQFQKRKAKVTKTVTDDSVTENPQPDYNKTSHGIFFDENKRKFIRVDVEYCMTTGLARIKNTLEIADSQPVALYKFIELITKKIMGISN